MLWLGLAASALALLIVQGCSSMAYYAQSVDGEMSVLAKRRPISGLIDDPHLAPELRQRLRLAQRMRNFASRQLHLPDNQSYRSYADLGRRYVVWNVFAAPEFSLKPKRWCFAIVGCLAYRGYFQQQRAQSFAAALRQQHYDVYVAGIPAYSTLGWFSDPLLSTVIDWPAADLAGLIFHELAHQKLYIKGDTVFNESFAVAVEREGVRRWMRDHGSAAEYQAYRRDRERRRQFTHMVMRTRERLQRLYARDLPPALMRRQKAQVFEHMRRDYQVLRRSWDGYTGYDRWMSASLNNAKIGSVVTYEHFVPAFEALLRRDGGDLPRFYHDAGVIGALPKAQRHGALLRLMSTPSTLDAQR